MSNYLPLLFANYSLLFTSLKTDSLREGWQRKARIPAGAKRIAGRGLAANKLYRGIYASHFLRSTGTTTISNNRIRTSMSGIVIDWQRSGIHRIDSNYVEIDKRLDTLNAYPRRGIWVGASNGFATTLVFGNAVRNESVQPFTGIGGINLGFNGLTRDGFFENEVRTLSGATGHGFSFEACNRLSVANNFSRADTTFASPANAYYFAATPQARVEQNCSDGTQTGFHFFDASPWLDFSRNNIGLHQPSTGLSLHIGQNGVIGTQLNKWNSFQYSGDDVIARDESGNTQNRFTVETNLSDPYERQLFYPRHDPANPDCKQDRFFRCTEIDPKTVVPDTIDCDTTTSGPQWNDIVPNQEQGFALAEALARDSIRFQHYNEASIHKLRRSIVKDLRDSLLGSVVYGINPDTISSSTPMALYTTIRRTFLQLKGDSTWQYTGDASDSSILNGIAFISAVEYGDTVYIARMLLDTLVHDPQPSARYGVEEKRDTETPLKIQIYPNPATTSITVKIIGEATGPLQLLISDLSGRKVLQTTQVSDQQQHSLYNLFADVYLYEIYGIDRVLQRGKLIINRP